MRYPSISIVIPTHNRKESLRLCLLSLRNQSIAPDGLEVIIVDNSSVDGTHEMLSALALPFPLHFIKKAKKLAFESSRLRNCGIKRSQGDIVVFLDSDMVVPHTYLQQHIAFYRDSSAVAVLGKMLYLASNERLNKTIDKDHWEAEDLGAVQLAGNTVNRFLEFSGNLPQYKRAWDFCIGANFSVSRRGIELAGMFDESLDGEHPAAADCAYGLQMFAAGVRLVYGRAALGVHQRNHPIRLHEDPGYFQQRQNSVWTHEEFVHRKWLPRVDADGVMHHILRKRDLNELVADAKAKYTTRIEIGPLGRLITRTASSRPLMLTLFLIHDGTLEQLEAALTWLVNNESSVDLFEVIVLDPNASANEKASNYDSSANVQVQLFEANFTVRYLATGTREHNTFMSELTDAQSNNLTISSNNAACRNILRRSYEDRLRNLLSEKPLAPVSLTSRTSNFSMAPNFLSDLASKLLQRIGT
jgi:glycosyltransferase involved in cell wall biosynthesis